MRNPFTPQVLEEFESKFSGKVAVKKDWNNLYVTTNNLTQSGGLINELWGELFKKTKFQNHKSWLVLGLATGTVAKIISEKYRPESITGVEIDPDMIRIGKKYFALDQIPNLEIVNADVKNWILKIKNFDYVLVDMYLGDKLPDFVYASKFIKKIKSHSQIAVFNHLFYDEDKKQKAQELIKTLGQIYSSVKLVRVLTNVLIICG